MIFWVTHRKQIFRTFGPTCYGNCQMFHSIFCLFFLRVTPSAARPFAGSEGPSLRQRVNPNSVSNGVSLGIFRVNFWRICELRAYLPMWETNTEPMHLSAEGLRLWHWFYPFWRPTPAVFVTGTVAKQQPSIKLYNLFKKVGYRKMAVEDDGWSSWMARLIDESGWCID